MNAHARFVVESSCEHERKLNLIDGGLLRAIFSIGLDTLDERLDELGLSARIEHDFGKLGSFLRGENSFVNPTFDPQHSDLSPDDFWLNLVDASGATVACSAERCLQTDDFAALVAAGRIWYRGGFGDIGGPASIPTLPLVEPIAGRVSASGSTYTVSAWRRQGLALVMSWYTRLISFRDLNVTANTGFVRQSLAQTTVPSQSYGYDRIEKIIDGYFPPQRGPETLFLCSIDHDGMARRVLTLPHHPTNPMRLGAVASRPAAMMAA